MIDRYLLRYFLAVIDQGNFSRAAVHCNVSQPTLSAGIAKLESSLGCLVFHRTNRRVELTEAGVALARYARRIEADFLTVERAIQGIGHISTLRLGVLTTIPGEWIGDFVSRLGLTAPDQRVELVEGRERELVERLMRGRIDVALTILRKDDGRLRRELLFSEGYALAMSASHPLAHEVCIDGADLADQPMIVRRHCELLSETSRYFTARGVRPFFPVRTTSDDRALQLVRAGLGVTVMPDGFSMPGIVRPQLLDFPFVREIGLVFAPHSDASALLSGAALRTLIDTVEAQIDL